MAGVLGVVVGLGAAGCFQTETGLDLSRLREPRGPTADSPAAAVRLLEWSYNRKAISAQHELFSGDFHFRFNPADSAGAPYRTTPWTRDDELISVYALFEGGNPTQPPARSIQLTFDKNLAVDPSTTVSDPEGTLHKRIRTQVSLIIVTADGNTLDISGAAVFYSVRGDAAVIPEELKQRGFRTDLGRWYIQRWDDETASGGLLAPGLHSSPAQSLTWGRIKAHYRSDRLP
jgi:hypothetical protein